MSYQAELDFLEETLDLAAQELNKRVGTDLKIDYKSDASLVTDADLASEKVILDRIGSTFPNDQIYSEEAGLSSDRRRAGEHIWIIDPLDGTTNFANGYPFYCVSIGRGTFDAEGRIHINLGGVIDPSRNHTYLAANGHGATLNGKAIHVAAERDLSKCFLVTGFYYMKGNDLLAEIERFARVAQACQSIRRDGAAALDLALVAAGVYDAFWEVGLQPWDLAAGTLLVSEAGGRVENYKSNGKSPYDIEGVGVVAGSGPTIGAIQEML